MKAQAENPTNPITKKSKVAKGLSRFHYRSYDVCGNTPNCVREGNAEKEDGQSRKQSF